MDITTLKSFELSAMITLETRCRTLLVQAQCYALQRADDVMSHDQKRASDWTRQDPVAEQLVVRDFTRPSFSGGLKGVACETNNIIGYVVYNISMYYSRHVLYSYKGQDRLSSPCLKRSRHNDIILCNIASG